MAWIVPCLLTLYIISCVQWTVATQELAVQDEIKEPTVLVVLLARNKEHTLPYFLTLFERLHYPKKRMALYVRSDHNQDNTIAILEEWLRINKENYHWTDVKLDAKGPQHYPGSKKVTEWSEDRFKHIIDLKEEALTRARQMWADFIWFLDMDVMLTQPDILNMMMMKDKLIIAPMLNSLATYSNFWGGMTDDYWYTRSENYIPILDRKEKGLFAVPMVHSFVLVDLTRRSADNLTFVKSKVKDYNGPNDDIINFAMSAKSAGVDMFVCNEEIYGFIPPPLEEGQDITVDFRQMTSIRLEVLVHYPPLPVTPALARFETPKPTPDTLGFDQIYLINLARRDDRRDRMQHCFRELGLDVRVWDAVDGHQLNDTYLRRLGVKQMAGYKDPWSHRDMTYGEIGCFLSHYFIWEDIVNNGYERVLLFEDDIRFEPFFREKVRHMVRQSDLLVDWDLIYLGRKKLQSSDEPWVDNSDYLVVVDYSYWTLCYAITLEGAKKLVGGEPLRQMVPVDEYIPIMFDKHPTEEWKAQFSERTLKAFSVSPMFVYPTHYTGEPGYISDTEDSYIIEEEVPSLEGELEAKALEMEVFSGIGKDEL